MTGEGDPAGRMPAWLGPALLAGVFVAGAAASWNRWADPFIDFGNDLYVAWRLSDGDVLYRDVAVRHGPLSHYVDAAVFRLFGTSIATLVAFNLAVLAAISAGLWGIFRPAFGRGVATATVAVFLAVFAFGQYRGIANFNYVTPYQAYQTHGLALGLGLILALDRCVRRRSAAAAGIAGLCLGLVFLTKAELFVPAAAVAVCGAAAIVRAGGEGAGARVGLLGAAALLPPVAAFGLLALGLPAASAARGVLGNWVHLGQSPFRDPFYRTLAGLDDPVASLRSAVLAALALLAFGFGVRGLDRVTPPGNAGRVLRIGVGLAVAFLLGSVLGERGRHVLMAGLPAVAVVVAGVVGRQAWREPGGGRWGLFLFAVYGVFLLPKMGLAADVGHYGFVLAMPAFLCGAAFLVAAPGCSRGTARIAGGVAVFVLTVSFVAESRDHLRVKDFALGVGDDVILVPGRFKSPRGPLFQQTIERLESRLDEDSTLLVMPEGAILNYWLKKRNPSPYFLYLPTEIRAFGEDRMLAALEADPPDYVAFVHRWNEEFGVGPFGEDPENGRALVAWVRERYRPVVRLGAEPFRGRGFGVVVLERDAPGSPGTR
jgi:hypothetical protein